MSVVTYSEGIRDAVTMTDDEALRFYNGVVAALSPTLTKQVNLFCFSGDVARRGIWRVLEMLHAEDMTATIGHAGTPVIKSKGS